jgi:hypothetical protein
MTDVHAEHAVDGRDAGGHRVLRTFGPTRVGIVRDGVRGGRRERAGQVAERVAEGVRFVQHVGRRGRPFPPARVRTCLVLAQHARLREPRHQRGKRRQGVAQLIPLYVTRVHEVEPEGVAMPQRGSAHARARPGGRGVATDVALGSRLLSRILGWSRPTRCSSHDGFYPVKCPLTRLQPRRYT